MRFKIEYSYGSLLFVFCFKIFLFPFVKTWDDELATLAEMNVKSCKFGHNKCFKTGRLTEKWEQNTQ